MKIIIELLTKIDRHSGVKTEEVNVSVENMVKEISEQQENKLKAAIDWVCDKLRNRR